MAMAHILGVSIPRSGHHFLVRLLRECLGPAFGYCEYYTPDDCCHSIPCSRTGDVRLFYQKNHDFELDLPAELPDVVYAIQYRDPVMSLLSDREYLAAMEGEARASNADEYVVWLGRRASYYDRFFAKWVRPARARHVLVPYDELAREPTAVLERLFRACELAMTEVDLLASVARVAPQRAEFPPPPVAAAEFVPRTVEQSRFYDPTLMPVVESLILDRIGDLGVARHLARVAYDQHPVSCVYRAEEARRAGDLAAALEHLDRAVAAAPANAYLHAERSGVLCSLRRVDEAVSAANRAVAERPSDASLVRRASEVHADAARHHLEAACELAQRLVEQIPQDGGAEVHLAQLLLQLGDPATAQVHANRALQLGSRDPDVWRFASEIFASTRNWPAAIEAVRGALALAPGQAEYHHHLANVFTLAGRADEAEPEHRRAIALAPTRPGWRWKFAEDLRSVGRETEARAVVAEALALFPDHPALMELGRRLGAVSA